MYRKKNSPERDRAFENIETVATTEQMKRNKDCEPKFREWILEVLKHIGMIEFREAVNSGAEHAGCSQNTIVRYLDKMCSYAGECEYYLDEKGKKFIRLKEHFRVKHNGVKSRSDNP